MKRWRNLYFVALALLVVGAHVALLRSDRIADDIAIRLTLTNAAIWAVIVIPAIYLTWRSRRRR
ncbi:MAG: phenylalanyl-tRNA synthetase subunit beta [Rubricella sp.]